MIVGLSVDSTLSLGNNQRGGKNPLADMLQ